MAIRSVRRFIRQDLAPRRRRIVSAPHFLFALLIATILAIRPSLAPILSMDVADLAVAVLTYSAITIGFGLSGALLGLTLPSHDFAVRLQKSEVDGKGGLADLVFVFVWTALVHVVLLIGISFVWILRPSDVTALASDAHPLGRIGAGLMVGLGLYGLGQFLVAVLTIMSVANVYIRSLESDEPAKGATAEREAD